MSSMSLVDKAHVSNNLTSVSMFRLLYVKIVVFHFNDIVFPRPVSHKDLMGVENL